MQDFRVLRLLLVKVMADGAKIDTFSFKTFWNIVISYQL